MRARAWLSCTLLFMFFLGACRNNDDAPKPLTTATAEKKNADDGPGVTVKPDAQKRAGIRVEVLAAHELQPESIAYGRLEEDPSSSFIVRAPFAGVLAQSGTHDWPSLGQSIPDGTNFGRIEPRLTVTDQIGLKTQLATARADLNASIASVAAAQAAYDRARVLNADNKNISDRALQDSAAKLASEKAREAGARTLIQVLESSLAAAGTSDARPIIAIRGGEVVEVTAQPGESVEQGAAIVRLARFDRMIARIDLPVGEHFPAGATTARIVPVGFETQPPLQAQRIGPAAATDPHAQGVSMLFRLSRTLPGLRPGAAVAARFTLPGTAGTGITLPPGAIVQQDGRAWVYVQTGDDRFSRRPISSELPGLGFHAGDRVVVAGAQSLLSEEFKSQNDPDN